MLSSSLRFSSTSSKSTTRFLTMSTFHSPNTTSSNPEYHDSVLKYHNQTKHSLSRYARGPGGLDWANQPSPFRRYPSAPLIPLHHPSLSSTADTSYASLFLHPIPPKTLSDSSISQFFYDSLALSAWKTTGFSTWSLRVNPSSGNLHPTEAYLVSGPITGLSGKSFVAHYAPKEHAVEIRAELPAELWRRLCGDVPEGSFLVGISSIFWREAWKYGERAFRYCNHDVGHAIAAIAMAAAELGWDSRVLDGLGHRDLELMMGVKENEEKVNRVNFSKGKFSDIEFEHPDCAVLVFPRNSSEFEVDFGNLSSAISEFSGLEWKGKANSLSKEHVYWDIIYKTGNVVKKPLTTGRERIDTEEFIASSSICEEIYKSSLSAREIVRKRRSAVDMDGLHIMDRNAFYQILLHCLPSAKASPGRQRTLPFRVLPWEAELHMALFVHRVSGLEKGLYFLVRNEGHFDGLRKALRSDFEWEKPAGCPGDLPLYMLARGDCRELAKRVSCHQDIAGDGCFSLGMVARFEKTLLEKHVWMYPRLFWESGVLGQVLYLEAHAVGISATGIGCYFDDAVHEILGLSGSEFQSLYHFTVGSPVVDKRIMNLPAYPGPEIDA